MEIYNNNNVISIINDNETINIINCGIMENVKSYTILLEKDSNILYSCDNFKKLIRNNTVNKKLSDIFCQETYIEIRKIMLESIFTNKQVLGEVILNFRTYKIIMTPISNANLITKYILFNCYDVSRNKKIEEEIEDLKIRLEESNSVKSIFLSNISHELRTPMNSIIGFSDILLQKDQTIDQSDRFLKSINLNAKYLDELLNNILDYAKLESKEFDVLYENFSIFDLFDELNDIFEDVNYKKNLDFVKLEFVKTEDKKIISDFLRLKQVLFNVISNSIKFTSNGYIKISYTTSGDTLVFKVEDTGIGIQEDKIKFVFDRFWQCDSSSKKKYKGTGLGLSISKGIIELLNGEIRVESVIEKGTTFYVKIPLEEIRQDTLVESKDKTNFSGKIVLIIDEMPINYSLLGIYLNSMNINIVSADNGKEAIKIYKKQKDKIKLIFLDLNLPDMNSIDVAKSIKNIKKDCIIVSKSGLKNKKNEFVDYHLKKPINKNQLLSILNKVWQK